MRRLTGGAWLAALVLGAAPAQAGVAGSTGGLLTAPPVECGPGEVYDPSLGTCVIVVEGPGQPGDPNPDPDPDPGPVDPPEEGGGGAVPPGETACTETIKDQEVPCEVPGGWHWVQGWNAYARLADPQPPHSDPVWEGSTEGAIYDRGIWLGDPSLDPSIEDQVWSATPPWEDVPNPLVLAYEAIAAMNLTAVDIGIVPEDGPGRVGLLGLPTWMWAENPSADTVGPITRSASAGGYSVTATGRVDRIVWDMGDGTTVVCTPPGTPYEDRFGDMDSPDCGHRYSEQGHYAVSATSFWVISWAGLGQSGTIEMELVRDGQIVMGEAQVLSQ